MEENQTNYSEVEEEIKDKKKEKKEKKMSKEEKRIVELEEQVASLNEKYLYTLAQMKDLHKTYEKENQQTSLQRHCRTGSTAQSSYC